jgi:hypothetical protein
MGVFGGAAESASFTLVDARFFLQILKVCLQVKKIG